MQNQQPFNFNKIKYIFHRIFVLVITLFYNKSIQTKDFLFFIFLHLSHDSHYNDIIQIKC